MKPKTASELASRVLKHPRGGLKALLELADGSERDWLEFKAATYPLGGHFKNSENKHDYRWNVAKAAIALANSIGGVVLLGVNDAGVPIGIEASDPDRKRERDGAEAFRRDVVLQQVLHPKRGWRTGTEGNLKVVNPVLYESLLALEEIRCGEESILAILVDPVPRGYGHIVVEKTVPGHSDPVVYVRRRGGIGQVRELSPQDPVLLQAQDEHPARYEPEARQLWDRFLARVQIARPVGELDPHILRHLDRIIKQLSPFEGVFTPLDGVQRGIAHAKPETESEGRIPELSEEWLRDPIQPGLADSDDDLAPLMPDRASRQGLVTDLLDDQRQAVLIGDAGSGKSTCFRTLALRSAKQWERGRAWPIFVSLAQYSSEGLAGLFQRGSGIEWEDLAPQVAAGEVILYLDALNQCPDSLYESCCTEIASLLSEYPRVRLFISARSSNDVEQFRLSTVQMKAMSREQQLQFLQAYLGEAGQAAELLGRLYQQPGGDAIAGSPVLLRIVAEIARESSDLPTGRAALYRRFLEIWYQRETEKAGLSDTVFPWQRERVIDALSVLAFRGRQRGWGAFRLHQARDILVPILGEDVDRFIDKMAQGLTLVRDEEAGTVGFWHETIEEYLCAEYLAARHEDLAQDALAGNFATKLSTWAMPLAFAFELIDEPSDALVHAAWQVEPLIATAAARDSRRLASIPIEGDPWTRGLLRALRGEDASSEAREITIAARLPPKYSISPYLVSTLRGGAFWYAAGTHEAGASRLGLLQSLLCGRRFPWIELLPDALAGNSAWGSDLGPALRAVVGAEPTPSLAEVLSTATVAELCALRRRGKISAETFLSSWEHALGEASGSQLDMDLIDILRTEREKVRDNVRKMLPVYRTQLRSIAAERSLSFRLLNILVRERVITAREIRSDTGRLDDILSRMSVMNAIRLAKSRVVCRTDLDEQERTRLIYECSRRQINDALNVGLFLPEDLPPALRMAVAPRPADGTSSPGASARRARYLVTDLADKDERMRMEKLLRARRWEVTVKSLPPEGGFGFAEHPEFDSDIFFLLSAVTSANGDPISRGQIIDARLATRFDRRKERWAFAIDSGRVVDDKRCR